MSRFSYLNLVFAALVLSGCASSSDEISASYVSPLPYQNYSCEQLGAEAQRISIRVAQVSGVQDKNATNDALITTAAVIVFWPAAFFTNGDGNVAAELARLKGEFEAIEKVSVQKSCGLEFRKTPPPKQKAKNQASDQYRPMGQTF